MHALVDHSSLTRLRTTWIKFLTVGVAAFLATLVCFYLMLFLISKELRSELEVISPSYVRPSITEPREEKPIPTRTKLQKVAPLEPPPNPEVVTVNRTTFVELHAERPTFGSMADLIGPTDIQLELDAPNSELTPVMVIQPAYPLRAAMREIEGYVIVQFSVKENGTVVNPIVVDSEPGEIFDQAALAAITRFRFKPREVGGDPVRVDNVQLKFAFNLESLYEVDQP